MLIAKRSSINVKLSICQIFSIFKEMKSGLQILQHFISGFITQWIETNFLCTENLIFLFDSLMCSSNESTKDLHKCQRWSYLIKVCFTSPSQMWIFDSLLNRCNQLHWAPMGKLSTNLLLFVFCAFIYFHILFNSFF
jgi:hypothetical protein